MSDIEVPYYQLNPETLRTLVEAFITREGEAIIVLDEKNETCNIVPRDELRGLI